MVSWIALAPRERKTGVRFIVNCTFWHFWHIVTWRSGASRYNARCTSSALSPRYNALAQQGTRVRAGLGRALQRQRARQRARTPALGLLVVPRRVAAARPGKLKRDFKCSSDTSRVAQRGSDVGDRRHCSSAPAERSSRRTAAQYSSRTRAARGTAVRGSDSAAARRRKTAAAG